MATTVRFQVIRAVRTVRQGTEEVEVVLEPADGTPPENTGTFNGAPRGQLLLGRLIPAAARMFDPGEEILVEFRRVRGE